jgi:putative transposase
MNKAPSYNEFFPPMIPEVFYHVFNRTNNKEVLYRNDENRYFFLQKTGQYLSPILEVYAYCLMGNHFHFLVKTKSAADIQQWISQLREEEMIQIQRIYVQAGYPEAMLPNIIEEQFRRFFNAYSKSFNKMWQRSGNLLHRRFRRLPVQDDLHLTWLVYYIHTNPVKHGISSTFTDYRWSSYQALIATAPTRLCRTEVLRWFGGRDRMIAFHTGDAAADDSIIDNLKLDNTDTDTPT